MELHDSTEYEHLPVNENSVREIVLSYLIHNCYKESAEAFISSTSTKCAENWAAELDKRKEIYDCTIKGDSLKAIELIDQLDPGLLERNKDAHFNLLTLHFVELIRAKNCTDALQFARKKLSAYGKLDIYTEKLQDFVSLLAYEDPEKSPVFELLSLEHRQNIADGLNGVILAHQNLPSKTPLERAIEQLTVIQGYLNEERVKKGCHAISLKRFLDSLSA